ncbi:hypothetical protein CHS0354_017068 [Potamilus streckersoni]|uniref:DZIP3-like HEPN domain-containing protein n=1 Tax=Potamilus streckersoni TaxID=2493646 RepID=A0AAE0VQN9_9BIVA|nr:hypothetical protein CHS0354_017068 [Potamilus streckersoni]
MASSKILAPSAEKVNFSRIIALLIDGGKLALRCQFDQHFPPSCLDKDLCQGKIRKTLGDMKRKGTINDIQWYRLYPPTTGPPVSSENFDISLFTCLLRNICGLNPPKTGWDNTPSPGDKSPEADIVRIRLLRNEVPIEVTKTITLFNKNEFLSCSSSPEQKPITEKMNSAILIILFASTLFQASYSCGIWNENKPCHCACEDASASCRAYCGTITGTGVQKVIEQNRCYNNCFNTFTSCYNGC